MSVDVIMPQMGESIAEGTITKWLKQVGDEIKRDEPLFEISTDKVNAEIPAPASGILTEIKVQEGETVPINTVVAVIDGGQPKAAPAPQKRPEAAPQEVVSAPPPPPQAPAEPAKRARAEAPPRAPEAASARAEEVAPAIKEEVPSKEEIRRKRSSPLVRRIASEHGIDISQIEGTGLSGRVTKNDILSYIENRAAIEEAARAAAAAPAARPSAPPVAPPPTPTPYPPYLPGERIEIEPMSPIRKRTSEHMILSRRTSAHVTTVFEIDMTEVVKLRERYKEDFLKRNGTKLTYMPFIIDAAVKALKAFPIVNSSVDGDNIVYKKDINIGIAVALDWGLIVPVIRNADEKSLLGLARATNDLAERARSKRLKPEEVQGGTFTITNPGVFGSLFGTPIINQPQVAILGVGTIAKRPVVINDAIAIRSMAYFVLSFDHRVIDGAVADQFMAHIKRTLEEARFAGLE